jgi:hypothetical protein
MPVLCNNSLLPCAAVHPDRKPTGYTKFPLFAIDPPYLGLNAHNQVSLNTITNFHDHCMSNLKRKQRYTRRWYCSVLWPIECSATWHVVSKAYHCVCNQWVKFHGTGRLRQCGKSGWIFCCDQVSVCCFPHKDHNWRRTAFCQLQNWTTHRISHFLHSPCRNISWG